MPNPLPARWRRSLECNAAVKQYFRRPIVWAEPQALCESVLGSSPILLTIGLQSLDIEISDLQDVGLYLSGATQNLENRDRFALSHDDHDVQLSRLDDLLCEPIRLFGDNHRGPIHLIHALESRSQVRDVADGGEGLGGWGADGADHDFARRDPDAHRQLRNVPPEPEDLRKLRAYGGHSITMGQCRETCRSRVVVSGRERRSPEGDDGIADVLLDNAVVRADLLGHDGEVVIEQLDHGCRRELLAERREAPQVGEQDRGDAAFRLVQVLLRRVDEARDDARVDVLAKGFLDSLLLAKLFGHAIEGLGELADLVLGGHRNGYLQISGLDGLGPFHDPPERPNEALGTGRAHAESEDHRDHEQGDIQLQEAGLLGVEAQDRALDQLVHLFMYRRQVRAESLLELLEPMGQFSGLREPAGGVCG